MEIFQRGAEAIIYLNKPVIIKKRIKKSYRIEELDNKIRRRRTKIEAKLLRDARSLGILTPLVIDAREFSLEMEFIEGRKLKDIFEKLSDKKKRWVCEKIGEYASRLHEFNIIHGDLTTSNLILKGDNLYLIDFGLGFYSNRVEDKAVDIYLLYQALKSTHFNILDKIWEVILNTYKIKYTDAKNVIKKVEEIKERGRYK